MKKILVVTGIFPPDIGGPATYGLALAEKISDRSSVTVITYSRLIFRKDERARTFKVIRVWARFPKLLKHLIFFLRVLLQVRDAEVIFVLNAVSAGLPAMLAAKIARKRLVVRVVGDYAWEIAAGRRKTPFMINDFQKVRKGGWVGILDKLQKLVCQKADLVIVPSKYLADLVEGWGVDFRKIEMIYNGVNFSEVNLTKEEARRKIGIPGNIILSVGRLVPWKGFRMLIKVMPQLLGMNQFFRLVIVGDGPERAILEAMVKNLHLERKVYLVGKKSQADLAVYLAAAEMFVLNTGYEGFSHQILEAMKAGVPVITTAVGGNMEVIRQGENGFIVKYNDEFNLVEAVRTLFESGELRQHFVNEGRETADRFGFDKMINSTISALGI